ncbi:MAPEG family protein [Tropicibacter oceani]|uniref:MAPEG family protein n=1 Tax=Tropicibacter oceani TaxID=3058420 RepID=A0ABY8QH23_9RHOB|nr:MAPEG family protein [Tropicibacter oceani]WGW03929.1 MAPEG family protein [Tropicibacter oceani]
MTPELTALTLAALLQVVHFAIYSVTAQIQVGTKYAASPRDTPRTLTGIAGRAQRAMNNHFEGLILFAIAALTLTYADKADEFTAIASALYLIARVLYLPAYLLGLAPWRSLIWFIGFLATTFLLIKALL